ncbi:MAG: hypothetical protein HC853_15970, partial [Anaerolineae bacterium]|nr:hypothetical protein [Anaerolineae bacterium]
MACVLMSPSATSAGNPAPTVIHIDPVSPISAGWSFVVTGILYRPVENGNAGVPHRGVQLYIEPLTPNTGVVSKTLRIATVHSDAEGRLRWTVYKSLSAGRYRLYFLFEGTGTLQSSWNTTELVVTGSLSLPVQSQSTVLSVMPLAPIEPGELITLTVQLTNRAKRPLANQRLYLNLPGATQQRMTDAKGMVTFVIHKRLEAGVNLGTVRYNGQKPYLPTEQPIQLMMNPRP